MEGAVDACACDGQTATAVPLAAAGKLSCAAEQEVVRAAKRRLAERAVWRVLVCMAVLPTRQVFWQIAPAIAVMASADGAKRGRMASAIFEGLMVAAGVAAAVLGGAGLPAVYGLGASADAAMVLPEVVDSAASLLVPAFWLAAGQTARAEPVLHAAASVVVVAPPVVAAVAVVV